MNKHDPGTAVEDYELDIILGRAKTLIRQGVRILPTFYAYDGDGTEYLIVGRWRSEPEKNAFLGFLIRYFSYKKIVSYVMVGEATMVRQSDNAASRVLFAKDIGPHKSRFIFINVTEHDSEITFGETTESEVDKDATALLLSRQLPPPDERMINLLDELFEKAAGAITHRRMQ